MELIYYIAPINFYLKFSFVLFLFFLNIYLILTIKKEPIKELQSGFGNKNLRGILSTLGSIGGFLSAYITIKNEMKDIQIGKLDQLMEEEREGIRRGIDKDKEEHLRLLNSIENNRDELINLHIEKAKMIGQNDRLFTLHNSIKDNILSFKNKSTESNIKLSELGILDQLIKQDTNKFGEELNSLLIENSHSSNEIVATQDSLSNIKESSFLNFDLLLEWFESLNGIKKLAFCLILGKSVILSALISIIFIFYGNILIEKYNLENKYPKLAKLIQLRQKFQKYYFRFYCLLIFTIVITEIIFGVAILLL